MKRSLLVILWIVGMLSQISLAFAAHADLVLPASNVRFGASTFIEGKPVRIYATVISRGNADLKGVVKFFDGNQQIHTDQPISVLAGKEDSVFVDWIPGASDHTIKIVLVPFEHADQTLTNNTVIKIVTSLADTDRDSIPNIHDPDDDNDGTPDENDSFPLNKNESLDSDGDTIGNNKDDDDDNDGVKDSDDALPLNAKETLDTDKDSIGNNEDTDDDGDSISDEIEIQKNTDPLKKDTDGDSVDDGEDAYPLDPTQARDYDKDGIGDAKDLDADNDGIPKTQDVNDTNLGPIVKITTDSGPARRVLFPGEIVTFETTTSLDPDGKIIKSQWQVEGVEEGVADSPEATSRGYPNLQTVQFENLGSYLITATLIDDKGESRTGTLRVFVTPAWLPWVLISVLFVTVILAIFFIFSYTARSAPRRSRWENLYRTLDTILKWLPEPKRKKKL